VLPKRKKERDIERERKEGTNEGPKEGRREGRKEGRKGILGPSKESCFSAKAVFSTCYRMSQREETLWLEEMTFSTVLSFLPFNPPQVPTA
jgi:hypothetical protein